MSQSLRYIKSGLLVMLYKKINIKSECIHIECFDTENKSMVPKCEHKHRHAPMSEMVSVNYLATWDQ